MSEIEINIKDDQEAMTGKLTCPDYSYLSKEIRFRINLS